MVVFLFFKSEIFFCFLHSGTTAFLHGVGHLPVFRELNRDLPKENQEGAK